MKVLLVASYNNGYFSPFVKEQANSLHQFGIDISFFPVVGKGYFGYFKNRKKIIDVINKLHPDIIHAHYGLCGLLANLQRRVPVVTTYHGCDIQAGGISYFLSKISIWLSAYNIYVSKRLYMNSNDRHNNCSIIPCGICLETFTQIPQKKAKLLLGLKDSIKYVLFAGAFDNDVKNFPLAKEAIKDIDNCEIIEMKGHSRETVHLLMNAVDCLLMTSHREGSPMVIKEAMACGCPIVSVDVGDVKNNINGVNGCYIVDRTIIDVRNKVIAAINYARKTNGRKKIEEMKLDNYAVTKNIIDVYNKICR